MPWLDNLTRLWDLYLLYGGFPVAIAAANAGNGIPERFMKDVFGVIYRDVVRDSQPASRLPRTWSRG